MGRPYSDDLRERVVRAVIKGGLSRHQAAAQFGVGISTAINWVRASTRPAASSRTRSAAIGQRRLRAAPRLADATVPEGFYRARGWWPNSLSVAKVDYRTMWEFVHAEKLSYKKDADCRRAGSS
jgi:Transposase and inactivated derivatives